MKTSNDHFHTPNEIGAKMLLTMSLSSLIEYNEYITFIGSPDCTSRMDLLKERGMSLGLSTSHMKDYLKMKHDFKEWFVTCLSDTERERFISFITDNIDKLMKRSLDNLEMVTKQNFISSFMNLSN
jgi:hypothetical protein